jgi:hypothetical protein
MVAKLDPTELAADPGRRRRAAFISGGIVAAALAVSGGVWLATGSGSAASAPGHSQTVTEGSALIAHGGENTDLTAAGVVVNSIKLPVGTFMVTSSGTFGGANKTLDEVSCWLAGSTPGHLADGYTTVQDLESIPSRSSVVMQALVASSGETITVKCRDNGLQAASFAPTITAIQVSATSS